MLLAFTLLLLLSMFAAYYGVDGGNDTRSTKARIGSRHAMRMHRRRCWVTEDDIEDVFKYAWEQSPSLHRIANTHTTCPPASPETKIFCVGFSKTGTTSMMEALEMLGYKSQHFDPLLERKLIARVGHAAYTISEDYANGWPTHDSRVANSLRELLEPTGVQAFGDMPYPLMFRELYAAYPDAYFILTKRDVSKWLRSAARHYKRGGTNVGIRALEFGSDRFDFNFARSYIEHSLRVLKTIPCCQLLVFDAEKGDSWQKLTDFLAIDMPTEAAASAQTGFVHRNRRGM